MLPLTPFEKIVKQVGIKRISREALEEMREVIEEVATEIAEESSRLARHAGRKTIKSTDIQFVAGVKSENK